MSCVSQMYNCTLTWIIENFSVFLDQMGGDFCVPEAEVETFDNVKWILGLRKDYKQLTFSISKRVDDASEHQTLIDFMVSVVGIEGSLHFSKIESGVKFGNGTTQVKKNFTLVDEVVAFKDLLFPKDALTIRIEMRFCDSNPLVLRSTVRTKMKIEHCSFTWSLKGLSTFQAGESLSFPIAVHLDRSPKFSLMFSMAENKLSLFCFQLKLHKHSAYEERRLTSGENQAITAEDCDILLYCGISALSSRGKVPCISKCLFFKSSTIDDTRTVPNDLAYNYYNPPSEIHMSCKFSFADGKYGSLLEQLDYSYPSCQTKFPVNISESVLGQSLFKEQKFVDVTLKAGNRSFKAHKAVLSSASPVFNAMFDHDMKEQSTGVVSIDDMKPDILESMLKFMYTNSIDNEMGFEKIGGLFAAADKYQMDALKHMCSVRLVSMVRSENVCRVLYLAYLHEDKEMKTAAKSFFAKRPVEVLDSKEWSSFMDICIQGATAKPTADTSPQIVRQLGRSLSLIRQRISSCKIIRFHTRG